MKLYRTRVRLGGSILNEVWLDNVTASQLLVLTEIHKGGDNFPLAEVSETGSVKRTDARERARLRPEYIEYRLEGVDKLLRDVLGAPGTPLPQFYAPPVADPMEEEYDDSVIEPAENVVVETLAKPVDVIR